MDLELLQSSSRGCDYGMYSVLPYHYYCALEFALLTITTVTEEPLPHAPGAAGSSPSQGFKLL